MGKGGVLQRPVMARFRKSIQGKVLVRNHLMLAVPDHASPREPCLMPN